MTKLFIAHTQKVYLEGLMHILQSNKEFQIVGTATESDELNSLVATRELEILLADEVILGDKLFERLAKIRSTFEDLQIILILSGIEPHFIFRCVRFGIKGLILANEEPQLIRSAIREVATGEQWMSYTIFAAYLTNLLVQIKASAVVITDREKQLLNYLLRDMTNKDIAREMQISERTVEYHINQLLVKLKVRSRVGITLWAKNLVIAKSIE